MVVGFSGLCGVAALEFGQGFRVLGVFCGFRNGFYGVRVLGEFDLGGLGFTGGRFLGE